MDHRFTFPNAALMWWCGTGLAADQLAIAIGQGLADRQESPPPDARMVVREFALLSSLS